MKNNHSEQPEKNQTDKLGEILRAGFTPKQIVTDGNVFTNQVLARIESLEPSFVLPGFFWVVPVVLVVMLTVTVAVGLKHEEKTENPSLDDLLLVDMPTETQNMLSH